MKYGPTWLVVVRENSLRIDHACKIIDPVIGIRYWVNDREPLRVLRYCVSVLLLETPVINLKSTL